MDLYFSLVLFFHGLYNIYLELAEFLPQGCFFLLLFINFRSKIGRIITPAICLILIPTFMGVSMGKIGDLKFIK